MTAAHPLDPPMRSYAQNFEDVRLARVFRGQATGFYVDVGAARPDLHSVTRWFYQQGWSGVDVEPDHELAELLRAERTRDVVVEAACSDREGSLTFYETGGHEGWSTVSENAVATVAGTLRTEMQPRTVAAATLERICSEHVRGRIDFLKIDAEGHETAVLRGIDLRRWRPRVLVVEATAPHEPVPTHADWEPLVLDCGYVFATFDGLNRFYVEPSEAAWMVPLLDVPISPFDNYELDQYLRQIEARELRIAALERRIEECSKALDDRRRTSLRVPAGVASTVRRGAAWMRAARGARSR